MKQLSMFEQIPAKKVRVKTAPAPKTASMFSDKEFFEPAKKTVMYPDFRGTLALEREDPRTAEQKAADLSAEARANTTPMPLVDDLTSALSAMPATDRDNVSDFHKHHITLHNTATGQQAIVHRFPADQYQAIVTIPDSKKRKSIYGNAADIAKHFQTWGDHLQIR